MSDSLQFQTLPTASATRGASWSAVAEMPGRSPRIGDTAVGRPVVSAHGDALGLWQPWSRFAMVAVPPPAVESRSQIGSPSSVTSQRPVPAGLAPKSGSRLPQSKVAPRHSTPVLEGRDTTEFCATGAREACGDSTSPSSARFSRPSRALPSSTMGNHVDPAVTPPANLSHASGTAGSSPLSTPIQTPR